MQFLVKVVLPEGIFSGVSLMIVLAIAVLEVIWARFSLFGFKFWWVCLEVCFVAPSEVSIMFNFVWAITFNVL